MGTWDLALPAHKREYEGYPALLGAMEVRPILCRHRGAPERAVSAPWDSPGDSAKGCHKGGNFTTRNTATTPPCRRMAWKGAEVVEKGWEGGTLELF